MASIESTGLYIPRVLAFGVPSSIILFASVKIENIYFNNRLPFERFLLAIGDASYSTYLSHIFIVEGFKKIIHPRFNLIDPSEIFGTFFILFFCLIIGNIVHTIIEKPLLIHLNTLLDK